MLLCAADPKAGASTGTSMEQAVGAKPFVPSPNKGAGAMTSLDKAVDAKPFVPQGTEDASKGNGQIADTGEHIPSRHSKPCLQPLQRCQTCSH